ncbi:hypothetical protein CGRA01v4_12664 [Colletotrichum graminicola]|nr:hypothetical protein CGRA01v4_12664 [Colletotrichum graminicola]
MEDAGTSFFLVFFFFSFFLISSPSTFWLRLWETERASCRSAEGPSIQQATDPGNTGLEEREAECMRKTENHMAEQRPCYPVQAAKPGASRSSKFVQIRGVIVRAN